jgi:ATP-binding cassette subfamily B protein/subfamily B ATP-binding cassette protein MsbA
VENIGNFTCGIPRHTGSIVRKRSVQDAAMDSNLSCIGIRKLSLWSLSYAGRRWPALLLILLTMLLKTGLEVLKPWPLKLIIDNVLGHKPLPAWLAGVAEILSGDMTGYRLLAWSVAAMVALFFLGWSVGVAESLAGITLAQRMFYDLAADLFSYLQRLSLRFHRSKSVGDSIRRVTSDCSCVATIVKDALLPIVGSSISLVAMFAVLWQLDPALSLLSLATVPYMIWVFRRYAGPMEQCSYEQQQAEGRLYNTVEQTFSSLPVVQAFGGEKRAEARFAAGTDSVLQSALRSTHVDLQFKVLMGLATVTGTAAVMWVGGSHVLDGKLSIGSIIVFLSYLRALYSPLETLMYSSTTIQGAAGGARRVLEILQTEPDVKDVPGALPLPPIQGHIRLNHVTFGYSPDRMVLDDVSFEALPGQTVAIVGATGAGKTTLISLLPRFYDPWKGNITFDGIDIYGVQLKSLREQVALVLQEPFLFPLSIADNIAYARPNASQEEIESAARAANAHDFIVALPNGYNTVVGERGATLSGGERQRLSIARALLKNAPILILDEPTSALDVQTESLFLEALELLMRGRTTLIIAHRLSTIRHADQIVVLDNGRVVEQGRHDELLAARGMYSHLHTLQFGEHALATVDQ